MAHPAPPGELNVRKPGICRGVPENEIAAAPPYGSSLARFGHLHRAEASLPHAVRRLTQALRLRPKQPTRAGRRRRHGPWRLGLPLTTCHLRSPVMAAALRDRVLSIGADPRDTADERFRKRLLVGVALIILPVGFVWGCLYWAVGERGVALTPWAYVTGSAISLAVFARTRNFPFLRTAQQLLILVAPALGTIMLGGLDESSSVILWSLFAPLGAVAFDRPGRAWPWFAAFVAAILLSLALSEVVRPDGADLPDAFVRTFDVLNIVVVSVVAMLLLVTFARGRGDRAGARRGAPAQRPPGRGRAAPPVGSQLDRRQLRRREHPVRGRRRLHPALEPTRGARGRRPPRSALHELRRARRPLRRREDQDDRRLLHGRGGRPEASAARSRTRAGGAGARDARVREDLPSPKAPSTTCASASASARARWWPA